jgi:hypothetical protein
MYLPGFSPSVFGTGAGIFFVGYILFEVPSNLALQHFGARIWIARIMVSWGIRTPHPAESCSPAWRLWRRRARSPRAQRREAT